MKKSTDDFKNEVYNLVGNEFLILGEYVNGITNIKIKHSVCGYEYLMQPGGFLGGQRCPKCSGKAKRTNDEFRKEVFDLVGSEYDVIGYFVGVLNKITFKHNLCNYVYDVSPSKFISAGQRCPQCAESKGEQSIRKLLSHYNINYKKQYAFSDCKNINPLPFDFAIFDGNNNLLLLLLIEFDGEFHYHPIRGEKLLKYQQRNDSIKNEYCTKNNITLLRIPYWEFDNITKIINEYLINLNLLEIIQNVS